MKNHSVVEVARTDTLESSGDNCRGRRVSKNEEEADDDVGQENQCSAEEDGVLGEGVEDAEGDWAVESEDCGGQRRTRCRRGRRLGRSGGGR